MTDDLARLFAALADPTRLAVFEQIAAGAPMTATELSKQLPVSRQAISKHLSILDDAGLVERTRSGREVRFTARGEHLEEVVTWAAGIGAEWDARLARLRRTLG